MTRICAVAKKDFDELIEMLDLVFRPDKRASMRDETPQLLCEENRENLRVVYDGSRVVSHFGLFFTDAFVLGHRMRICQVGGVATHPDWRGKGLATQLLMHCCEYAQRKGAHLLMISGGRGLYQRNGARPVAATYRGVVIREQLEGIRQFPCVIRPIEVTDLPRASFLYQCKPVHFYRPLSEWGLMHRLGKAKAGNAQYLGCFCDVRLEAYTIVSFPGKEGRARMHEHAGRTDAVLALMRHVLHQGGVHDLSFDVQEADIELLNAVKGFGVEMQIGPVEGTVRVIDFVGLMESFRDYFRERAGLAAADSLRFAEQDGIASIATDAGSVQIDDAADLAEFLFGVGGQIHVKLASADGAFGELLRSILPLPFPRYDMTYV